MARSRQETLRDLPGNATYHHASEKKYDPLVVFVHFFGGSQKHLFRHIRLISEIGFDCVTFDLSDHRWRVPLSKIKRFGIEHVWADEVREVLAHFSDRPLILFTFSNPSASAMEAMTKPKVYKNILGMICDGGPFMDLLRCSWNLCKEEFKINNRGVRTIATGGMFLLWSPLHEKYLNESLSKIPNGFPILSIRAWKDKLVPVTSIDKVFEGHKNIDLEVLDIPNAEHLTGLRDSPESYHDRIESFLTRLTTKSSRVR
ncbi:MAG: alpha/beta hydrolase [Bdellovibrionales bacterium]|nr:alpha/beta hydrolase [Bdellovibrionales bacterium]